MLGAPLSPRDIVLGDKIGEGQFGDVHKGVLHPNVGAVHVCSIHACSLSRLLVHCDHVHWLDSWCIMIMFTV